MQDQIFNTLNIIRQALSDLDDYKIFEQMIKDSDYNHSIMVSSDFTAVISLLDDLLYKLHQYMQKI